jgi:hypothetical protein
MIHEVAKSADEGVRTPRKTTSATGYRATGYPHNPSRNQLTALPRRIR